MRLRNCPSCYGRGTIGTIGRCYYCNGKKKMYTEYVQWENRRGKFIRKLRDELEPEAESWIEDQIKAEMGIWDAKNSKPRKFPKK